jgi:hypothetical protein
LFYDTIPCCVERHEELFAQAQPLHFRTIDTRRRYPLQPPVGR